MMRGSLHRAARLLPLMTILYAAAVGAAEPVKLRPPAVPLVVHDPYFSVWSQADRLTDVETTHWTGRPHPLRSLLRVDGTTYRVMGTEPRDLPALSQKSVTVYPTRTVYQFANSQVALTLKFITPALPSALEVLARPVTYLVWEARSADGRPHAVQLYFDAGAELAVDHLAQAVIWEQPAADALDVLKLGTQDQPVLARKGDDLRIDWGHLYVAADSTQKGRLAIVSGGEARQRFVAGGSVPERSEPSSPRTVRDGAPVLVVSFDLGQVGHQPVSRRVMIAYDDIEAINYFGRRLRPYWRRNGAQAVEMLRTAADEFPSLERRCCNFDEGLLAELERAGGARYAALCSLLYRQALGGNKIAADADGKPLVFPKETFSNGCISTVDVLFPQAPLYLLCGPALTRGMLVPVLKYASSPAWPYPYAPHDLGTYPHATGQVYGMRGDDGGRMPVEESGNMLILLAALTRQEGHAALARQHWAVLTRWADYLVANGLDPENQLCSADMFGHLPHCTNLSLKAVIGLGAYAQLCESLGKLDEAKRYKDIARRYAVRWQEMAKDNSRTRLAYHLPDTWSMKHNLVWDRILETNLFPTEVGDAEVAWYLRVQNKYGLPVDSRTPTSLIDWAAWSAALARNDRDFQALVEPLFRYANETPSRVPLSDWFSTVDSRPRAFQARPTVGGVFIRLLADPQRPPPIQPMMFDADGRVRPTVGLRGKQP